MPQKCRPIRGAPRRIVTARQRQRLAGFRAAAALALLPLAISVDMNLHLLGCHTIQEQQSFRDSPDRMPNVKGGAVSKAVFVDGTCLVSPPAVARIIKSELAALIDMGRTFA